MTNSFVMVSVCEEESIRSGVFGVVRWCRRGIGELRDVGRFVTCYGAILC
jgi:hypothetical protein